ESAAKIPPVCSQRTPSSPKMWSKSTSSGRSWEAAVCPRSDTPTAPRTPNPRSVKLRPLRTLRPMPSEGTQRMSEVSTPPVRIKSSTSRPTSLSARAVSTPARSPKARRRPRATLYSPPPSHTRKLRAVRIRPSPGSSRSITSPRDSTSYRHSAASRICRVTGSPSLRAWGSTTPSAREGHGLGHLCGDLGEAAGGDEVPRDHPAAADGGDGGQVEVLGEVLRAEAGGGDEAHVAEGRGERLDRAGAAGGLGREERHGGDAGGERGLDLGGGDRAGQGEHNALGAPVDDVAGEPRGHD